ncbi:uncharacterized protein F4822DRAFT_411951 [Hypoxylon trugodes]|uniref:uncharacterized protein n=1 Tax=Hypoxylon trugodes TaxID=326681 RepID=UPI00219731D4|nr:uncharacterized protein F4822DRAFT_411951 [Hypoxylon trugodes]KAI1387043.1 hypothetical protein F4822DRAFT_411951 [Hypoxylon trugodes]
MGFLGVYKAIYDYAPQSEGELSISEGDVLYVLEKSEEDDWWKAKKKASADEEDEPVGLIPNNYIEEAEPVGQARALYEYTRQTDEELSFPEDAQLQVFDTSDPDWILVGHENDYGFVPANYIEIGAGGTAARRAEPEPEPEPEPVSQAKPEPISIPIPAPPILPTRPPAPVESEPAQSPPLPERNVRFAETPTSPASPTSPPDPAATLARAMQGRSTTRAATPPPVTLPPRQQYLSDESDGEPSPALPERPRSQSTISNDPPPSSHPSQRISSRRDYDADSHQTQSTRIAPGGFHLYNINEMVSIMGKKKKMPTTLGVNLKTGVILIAPEHAQDGPTQEWTADKMTHYSREGKHVFLELVRPSKSIDFHAGAKDTAEEIVSALGELSGAMKAEGLREVIMAGTGQSGQKRGQILYNFEAQGDDEVTVVIGDEVIILDDTKSEEWWQVRRLKSGKEGVVPSSYIEITDTIATSTSASAGINAGRSTVAQNRLEEERLTKEAIKREQKAAEVGPGMRLPERHSSLSARDSGNSFGQQRNKRENGRADSSRSGSKPKPDPSKVRTWTDRSKSFSVEAQFLGLKDGKINLHKMNGVKIAVPVAKMSIEDIEYVERVMGVSLDEDKPLSEVKRAKSQRANASREYSSKVGASIEPSKSDYDWFQFFLSCDVAVGLCERYAQAFAKDSMDESVLPDVDASVLRNLGLREGDIIKVTRYLDKKFGRDGKKRNISFAGDEEDGGSGGLFSGPGGTLRNNTRKGRPAPAVQTNDSIDPKAFSQQKDGSAQSSEASSPVATRPKAPEKNSSGGFDDDAWDVKPAKQSEPEAKPKPTPSPEPKPTPAQPQRPPTQAMQDLSLLSAPLEPTKTVPAPAPAVTLPPPQPLPAVQPQQIQAQPQGATPAFFTGIPPQQTGLPATTAAPAQPLNLGLGNRQRPLPPQVIGAQGALMPPPPSRPLSAPQTAQPSGFAPPPLQPQMTGIAPPGQSLNDLNQQRMQQQYIGNFQPQPTGQGMMPYHTGAGMQPQPGFGPGQFMQPQMTGAPQTQSPFADPRPQQFSPIQNQPTGFPGGFQAPQQFPQPTGINSYLPPALEPQRTGMPSIQPQPTGFGGGFGQGFNPGMNNNAAQQPPPPAPLQPQKTGPAPPVRFGVTDKIAPQPTGRRANLAQATPQNPFGF